MMQYNNNKKSNTLLSGSILTAAVFIGSAFLFQSNESVGIVGMIASIAIMTISTIFRKR
jgi:uncharacterized membrane protein (UPF0136 family)